MTDVPSSTAKPVDTFLSAPQLDAALSRLREKTPIRGLWAQLLTALQTNDASLAVALREWHGIQIVAPSGEHLLQDPLPTAGAAPPPEAGLWFIVDGQPLLLCEDPWSSQAAAALQRRPQAQLGLAQTGQLQRLAVRGVLATQAPAPGPVSAPAHTALDDSPVVQFVDEAIRRAYREGASDIHFETDRAGIQVKYRLDGVIARGER